MQKKPLYTTRNKGRLNIDSITEEDLLAIKLFRPSRIAQIYSETRNKIQKDIQNFYLSLYGRRITIKEQLLTALNYKLKQFKGLMENVEKVKNDIRKAIGYNVSFFHNGQCIPIEKIMRAWELAKVNARFVLIEKALFGI